MCAVLPKTRQSRALYNTGLRFRGRVTVYLPLCWHERPHRGDAPAAAPWTTRIGWSCEIPANSPAPALHHPTPAARWRHWRRGSIRRAIGRSVRRFIVSLMGASWLICPRRIANSRSNCSLLLSSSPTGISSPLPTLSDYTVLRYSRMRSAAVAPSPVALATCLVLPARASPAAKMPGTLVSK
jgi:hypothetical protein